MRMLLLAICVSTGMLQATPDIFRLLPKNNAVHEWLRKGEPRLFERDKLWEYIDGGADVYLEFGFARVATVDLTRGSRSMTIDVYEMKSLDGAFGIYARERDPKYHFIKIGAEGYQEGGTLNFYQSVYYVKITAFTNDRETQDACRQAADVVSRNIGVMKKPPSILNLFPADGLQRYSTAYEMTSYLGKPELRETWTARYTVRGTTLTAFICQLPSPSTAADRLKAVRRTLIRPGSFDKEFRDVSKEIATGRLRDSKEIVIAAKNAFLVGVHPATDKKAARQLLTALLSRLD